MIQHDMLQRFIFEDTNVRGEFVRLRASYQAVSERQTYPLAVKQLLGETLAATALLSGIIKFKGSLILQLQGNGSLKLLVAQSTDEHHLRGLAQWEGEIQEDSLSAMGHGHLAITIIPHKGERYQGIVEIKGNKLATSIENYFTQSEQLPTYLILAADANTAVGMLLQHMPDTSAEPTQNFWEHIMHLARTLTKEELLQLSNEEILKRLFHQEDIRLFEAEPVSFRCDCSLERMENALLIYGYEETIEIFNTNKHVTVTCEFCNKHYDFDRVDIERIFSQGAMTATDTKH